MTQNEKFDFFLSAIEKQYEALAAKESSTAQTLLAVILFAHNIKNMK